MAQTLPKTTIKNLDKTVILNHIDKLYNKQSKIWDSVNRTILFEIFLSVVIIALSSGVLASEDNFELSGLKIKASLTVILSGGATLLFGLVILFHSQIIHTQKMGREIKKLYQSIGYTAPFFATEDIDAFESSGFYSSLMLLGDNKDTKSTFAKLLLISVSAVTLLSITAFLPVIAQVAAGLKVMSLFNWQWWISIPFLLLIGSTITFIFVYQWEGLVE